MYSFVTTWKTKSTQNINQYDIIVSISPDNYDPSQVSLPFGKCVGNAADTADHNSQNIHTTPIEESSNP